MKVLHLPHNIASQSAVTVQALREIGVEARGIDVGDSPIQDSTGLERVVFHKRRESPVKGTLANILAERRIRSAIRWADVIHWHCGWALKGRADAELARRLGKPGLMEFWGSELRIPRIAAADNPYMARFYEAHPEREVGAEAKSIRKQRELASLGVACLLPAGELLRYVEPSILPRPYRTGQRLRMADYAVAVPDASATRPLLVHMPSSQAKKGTDAVLQAIDTLRSSHDFEFRLVQGVPRPEALEIVRGCDVFVDQFVVGDHGLATLEAMALGKPAVCFITESSRAEHPPELPVVSATQESLTETLRALIVDGERRAALGRAGRAYVEAHHDAHRLARALVEIYEELLAR